MKTDSIFYEIFQTEPAILCELLGNDDPRMSACGFGSQEIKETSFRLDGILVPPARLPDLPIVFVEAQAYSDSKGTLYSSFFSQIFLYLHDYQPIHDWQAILIFTRRSLDPGLPHHYNDFEYSPRFKRVYLDELGDAEDLSIGLALLKLIVEKKTKAPALCQSLVARSRTEFDGELPRQQNFIELITTILVYKFADTDRTEVEDMIQIPEIRQSRFFQEVKSEGIEEGLEQGLRQGQINAVTAMLKAELPLGEIARLLEISLNQARRSATPYLVGQEQSLSSLAKEWSLPLTQVEQMAIAAFHSLGNDPDAIAQHLSLPLAQVTQSLEQSNQSV